LSVSPPGEVGAGDVKGANAIDLRRTGGRTWIDPGNEHGLQLRQAANAAMIPAAAPHIRLLKVTRNTGLSARRRAGEDAEL
jgi:hypothetical protein